MIRLGLVLAAAAALVVAGCSSGSGTSYVQEDCVRRGVEGRSVPRIWNEVLLDAIRRDTPAPTVHARNLFHTSAAMWDAWAAYDPVADGYFVHEKREATNVQAAREAAMSFAAYRVLLHRYSTAVGLGETFSQLATTMDALCYRLDYVSTEGDSPAALGNRIAAAVIAIGRNDGSHERQRYVDTDYRPVNDPLVVAEPGADMHDPNRWQPLALAKIVAQNGLPVPGKVQGFIGPHWGNVKGFALPPPGDDQLPIDPGAPPRVGDPTTDAEYKQAAVDVIRYSSLLDPDDGQILDIGPGARGGNAVGTNDGHGHAQNPATGAPYAPNLVAQGDFARALAEFWADGPKSETPPGHWNAIANEVSDAAALDQGIQDRTEWDAKLYFALNGAVHDAAVAAWGAKGHYDSARPISMIRHLGEEGELPIVPGLVEVVTRASSAPGERHAHLRDHAGEIAIRAWRGNPDDPATQHSGVGWIRAVDWLPYQLPTFVTPAFAGYVSGHSTFSRAAAEVLTAFTGSPYFPGGMLELPVHVGELKHEQGPSRDLTLQWATYFDAADDAGISRLYMGIHISPDDFQGRRMGSTCGKDAWALAQRYFDGTARS
ncbi:MAG: vanadium-dependent haloperoxidase [Gaiellaceae bacterium]